MPQTGKRAKQQEAAAEEGQTEREREREGTVAKATLPFALQCVCPVMLPLFSSALPLPSPTSLCALAGHRNFSCLSNMLEKYFKLWLLKIERTVRG